MRKSILPLLLCTCLGLGGGCSQPIAAKPGQHEEELASAKADSQDEQDDLLASVGAFFLAVLISPFTFTAHQIDRANTPPAADALRMTENPSSPDQRREGIAILATKYDFGKRPPYTLRYQELASKDPDYTVRAMAIRALNYSRDATATPIFISALNDDNELVRLEAAKALANVPDLRAMSDLQRVAEGKRQVVGADGTMEEVDESKDVRIAAADALRNYRDADVARTLIGLLGEQDFAVAWQSRRSLIVLTGRDLKYDQGAWLRYLAQANPFS